MKNRNVHGSFLYLWFDLQSFGKQVSQRKRPMRKLFKEADKHELPGISDLDSIIERRTKTLIMSYIHDDEHFIHDFLEQLPSGRYRTLKYRSAWGKDCFLRAMIHSLNDIFK